MDSAWIQAHRHICDVSETRSPTSTEKVRKGLGGVERQGILDSDLYAWKEGQISVTELGAYFVSDV